MTYSEHFNTVWDNHETMQCVYRHVGMKCQKELDSPVLTNPGLALFSKQCLHTVYQLSQCVSKCLRVSYYVGFQPIGLCHSSRGVW